MAGTGCLLGVEVYQGAPILYSCGNLLADEPTAPRAARPLSEAGGGWGAGGDGRDSRVDVGCLARLVLRGSDALGWLELRPTHSRLLQVNKAKGREHAWAIDTLESHCHKLGTKYRRSRYGLAVKLSTWPPPEEPPSQGGAVLAARARRLRTAESESVLNGVRVEGLGPGNGLRSMRALDGIRVKDQGRGNVSSDLELPGMMRWHRLNEGRGGGEETTERPLSTTPGASKRPGGGGGLASALLSMAQEGWRRWLGGSRRSWSRGSHWATSHAPLHEEESSWGGGSLAHFDSNGTLERCGPDEGIQLGRIQKSQGGSAHHQPKSSSGCHHHHNDRRRGDVTSKGDAANDEAGYDGEDADAGVTLAALESGRVLLQLGASSDEDDGDEEDEGYQRDSAQSGGHSKEWSPPRDLAALWLSHAPASPAKHSPLRQSPLRRSPPKATPKKSPLRPSPKLSPGAGVIGGRWGWAGGTGSEAVTPKAARSTEDELTDHALLESEEEEDADEDIPLSMLVQSLKGGAGGKGFL